MSTHLPINPETARLAAENIADALAVEPESPINGDFFETKFDEALADNDVWQTFHALLRLLSEHHQEFISLHDLAADVIILSKYLDSIHLDILTEIKKEAMRKDMDMLRGIMAPVVQDLVKNGHEEIAADILICLVSLLENPLYEVGDLHQLLKEVKDKNLITEQPAKANFDALYEHVFSLLTEVFQMRIDTNPPHHSEKKEN